MSTILRLATPDDAPSILDIYGPLVRDSIVSFELKPALGGPHCRLGVLKDLLHTRDPYTLKRARGAARIKSRS